MAAASIVIFDPTANASYSFEAQGLTATKRLAPRGFVLGGLTRELQGAVSGPDPGVLGVKEKLPAAVIEGLNVEGTRSTATISAGKIGNERDIVVVDEVWYSPDLRINLLMKHSDPRSGETVYRLTGISRGEADPALFKVPAGYTLKEEPFRITPR
jgi:hypothetical protein